MLIHHYFYFKIFMLTLLLNTECSQQRRKYGSRIGREPRFMAYFVKSEQSVRFYQGWTCAGAIISPLRILTAATCIMNVDHLYAIVGYNKYVRPEDIRTDTCTKNRKKRVLRTYSPKNHKVLNSGWTSYDIGIAILESTLDFTDETYKIDCSYTPEVIKVNFKHQLEAPGADVIAVGWSHAARAKTLMDSQDLNEEYVRDIPLVTIERDVCKRKVEFLESTPTEQLVLDSNFICVQVAENEVSNGLVVTPTSQYDCEGDGEEANIYENIKIDHNTYYRMRKRAFSRRDNPCTNKNKTWPQSDKTKNEEKPSTVENVITSKPAFRDLYDDDAVYDEIFKAYANRKMADEDRRRYLKERRGLCQNDHGGPLIAWMGSEPIVIGVASTNLYNRNFSCIPPNLFTSTTPNGWFIKCSIKDDQETIRKCREMENKNGLSTNEVIYNWIGNGIAEIAPLLSLQKLISNFIEKINTSHIFTNPSAITSMNPQNGDAVSILRNEAKTVHPTNNLPKSTVSGVENIPMYQSDDIGNTSDDDSEPVVLGDEYDVAIVTPQYLDVKREKYPETIYRPETYSNENKRPGNIDNQRSVPNHPNIFEDKKNLFLPALAQQLPDVEDHAPVVKIRPLKNLKALRSGWAVTRYNFKERATIPLRSVTVEDLRNPDDIPNTHRIKWKRRHNKKEPSSTSNSSPVPIRNITIYNKSTPAILNVYSIKRVQWYYEKKAIT